MTLSSSVGGKARLTDLRMMNVDAASPALHVDSSRAFSPDPRNIRVL